MTADERSASLPQEQGPFGGRLITLAEACALADQIALEAERERQAARERDAADWAWLEDLEAGDESRKPSQVFNVCENFSASTKPPETTDADPKAGIVTPSTYGR